MREKIALVFALLLIQIVSAGISSVYWEKNPLEIHLGETKDIQIGLTSKEDTFMKLTLIEGGEIAKIIDKENVYFIEGEKGVFANIRVSIPRSLEEGDIRYIQIKAETESNKTTGIGVGLSQSTSKNIPVKIIEKPFNYIHAIILGILLLVILSLEIKRKN